MAWQAHYRAPDPKLWTGRKENTICRFYQIVSCLDFTKEKPGSVVAKEQPAIVLLGFASDEGVARNMGRIGAKSGPDKLKEKLGRLPIHHQGTPIRLLDGGTIVCNGSLEASQHALGELVATILKQNAFPVILGGGHEVAWGHYLGIHAEKLPSLGIINFDAHLDMRPLLPAPGVGSSGTAFLQIARLREKENLPFDYSCIGLQMTGNTSELLKQIDAWQVKAIFAKECFGAVNRVQDLIDYNIKSFDNLYVSLCLDVFAQSVAPGVSAPSTHGLLPWQVIGPLQHLAQSGKMIAFDVAELAPNLDEGDKTAQLGASIIAECIYHLKWKN